jgi:cytochrome bd-type quinol oxidase subunit 2
MFWVAILAVSILLYVLLDGFDLGVGILFGRPEFGWLGPFAVLCRIGLCLGYSLLGTC